MTKSKPEKKTAAKKPKRKLMGGRSRLVVKIEGDWETAIVKAMKKGSPPKPFDPPPESEDERLYDE